jgi:iron complex outermembrane receptor protein
MAVLVALGCLAAPNLYAQETDDLLEEDEDEVTEVVERISVTGSRIRRTELSSASPIQVISGEVSRELGLFDTTEVLQNTTQASGLQIDSTFSGFVLDNGPGATTVGFRGLGADRTLVLLNGRRIAPSGVGGAPTSPDIGVIPAVMIQRIENLFDGASTTYGSDAIAGVSNVILRKDVEGFEFQGNYSKPGGDGGEETTMSAMYGLTGDNYSFSIAAEYQERKRQSFGQSEFASNCDELLFENQQGERFTNYRGIGPLTTATNNCDIFPLTNRVLVQDNFFGFLYRTPGTSNVGVPNFSESTTSIFSDGINSLLGITPVDTNGDGIPDRGLFDGNGDGFADVNLQDPFYAFTQSDRANASDWVSPTKRISLFAQGDYLFQDDNDTLAYFEALYTSRDTRIRSNGASIFGDRNTVGIDNPFNPCGTDPINGTSCYAATNLNLFFGDVPLALQPTLNIIGDRDVTNADVSQYRLVGGITGNIGMLDDFGAGNWSYDSHISYSSSTGDLFQRGIVESRLTRSLENSVRNPDGSITCGDGCVPINLFADNLYQAGGGRFTAEEENYLFDDRLVSTDVKQTLISAFVSGDIFTLPWNDRAVPIVVGWEWRKDEIDTDPNVFAESDNLWGFFKDRGAVGERNLNEFYLETELPLLRGVPLAEEFTLTGALRNTNESFYDAETIWSIKGIWRPTTWLTVRGTQGTSYRAPNLRERFLLGLSGFAGVTDPCVVPLDARASADPNNPASDQIYDATGESRTQLQLDSCSALGVDPLALGLAAGGNQSVSPGTSLESFQIGTEDLDPERSKSKTWGLILENPFSEDVELTFSLTHFKIDLAGAVSSPGAAFTIAECYNNNEVAPGQSGFCDNIRRNADGFLDEIDVQPINVGFEGSRGVDYNVFYGQDFLVGDEELGVNLDLSATKLKSRAFDILGNTDDNVGEPEFPEWRVNGRLSLSYSDFRLNWFSRFIDSGADDGIERDWSTNTPACDGLDFPCRAVSYTDSYLVHNVSFVYTQDDYQVTLGVQNVFNEEPPRVDASGFGRTFSRRNIPLGAGYDTFGRTVFVSFGLRL